MCAACGSYPAAKRLAEWALDHPASTAENSLFYLNRMGFGSWAEWNEEYLRSDPEFFGFINGLVCGLKSGRRSWAAPAREDKRKFVRIPIAEWRDVKCLQFCNLYEQLDHEQLPEEVLDAYEVLDAHSGHRVAIAARELLIEKGYDPDEL